MKRDRKRPDMEVIRDIALREVERDGIEERAVGDDVEPVDPRKREPYSWELLCRHRNPPVEDVLLPARGGGKGHEA